MKLYNTLTRKIEEFKPLKSGQVGVYICGPTVYDYAHIGHSRTYINSDVLVRVLRWLDLKVKVVMNITDVGHLTSDADIGDDKIEKKAKLEKKTVREIADYYEEDFFKMLEKLNVVKPDIVAKVTDHIKEQIRLIKWLELKGFTYKTSDGIYFDTSKLKDYGKLARLDIEGLKEGSRVDKKEKKNPTDFALWKFSPKNVKRQMEWPSSWGVGFPGWHIECSAISMKYLGESFDIHTGGIDHIPVHHTNEIAQSESATGKPLARYWFHSNFLEVEGKKMSKSLNNFIRVSDLVKQGFDPMGLRYLFLTSHYRSKMNFTKKSLISAQEGYKRLRSVVFGWQGVKNRTKLSEDKLNKLQDLTLKFRRAVENDLSMPQAMAVVWQMVKSNIPEQDKWELITDWDRVLGLDLGKQVVNQSIPGEIIKLVEKREQLRRENKWVEADKVRKEIKEKGFRVKDGQKGPEVIQYD